MVWLNIIEGLALAGGCVVAWDIAVYTVKRAPHVATFNRKTWLAGLIALGVVARRLFE